VSQAVQALGLGLSTGVFCLGFCYPLLAPVLLSREGERPTGSLASLGLFCAGRLVAYLAVGAAAGLAGGAFAGLAASTAGCIALAVLGVVLAAYGVVDRLPRWRMCRVAERGMARRGFLFPLGLLAGVSPCPPFLLAVAAVLGSGSAGSGILFFFCFFVGTSVYLLPFALAWLPARWVPLRAAARIAAVAGGGWYLWLGVRGLV
jgi:sulfite exporter TauE/SafE